MTIEEKAKTYAGYDIPHSRDMVTISKMNRKRDGFKAGAEWMLERAIEWLKENSQKYNWWGAGKDMIEDFQKAMEE